MISDSRRSHLTLSIESYKSRIEISRNLYSQVASRVAITSKTDMTLPELGRFPSSPVYVLWILQTGIGSLGLYVTNPSRWPFSTIGHDDELRRADGRRGYEKSDVDVRHSRRKISAPRAEQRRGRRCDALGQLSFRVSPLGANG